MILRNKTQIFLTIIVEFVFRFYYQLKNIKGLHIYLKRLELKLINHFEQMENN